MSSKPRSIGLDIGERRIGVAISDPQGTTAAGLETISRHDLEADVAKIADIAKRHSAVEIVLRLPTNNDGSETELTAKVYAFGKKLANATNLPIIYEDERLSTISAIRTLAVPAENAGHKKELQDMKTAAIILQKYLDRVQHGNEQPPSA